MLKMAMPRPAMARAAPATVLGMSWNLVSANTGKPSATTSFTAPGPSAVMNSRPTFSPPTCGVDGAGDGQ